ncbi:MAG: hypothetical protein ACM3O3_12910 [Syntrophothermus sp.]
MVIVIVSVSMYAVGACINAMIITYGKESFEVDENIVVTKSLLWIPLLSYKLLKYLFKVIKFAVRAPFNYTDIKMRYLNNYVEVIEIEDKIVDITEYVTINNRKKKEPEYILGFHANDKFAYYYMDGLVVRISMSLFDFDDNHKVISTIRTMLMKKHEYEYKRTNRYKKQLINSIDL